MITNPNSIGEVPMPVRMPDDPETPSALPFKVHRYNLTDFDKVLDDTAQYIESNVTNVDAKIFEGNGRRKRLVHYRSLREYMASPTVKTRLREAVKLGELKEFNERIREMSSTQLTDSDRTMIARLREAGSSFDLGLYPDETGFIPNSDNRSIIPYENVVLPSTNSPYSKQMLFVDYLDMHRKSFEAATRNPLGKRIVRLIPQFVLGRSLLVTIGKNPAYQAEWDAYWKANKMKLRIKQVFRELLIYGEIFLRYFRQPNGLAVRSLDPSTIWDIITNPDDLEDVIYYHQQYVIANYSGPINSLVGFGTARKLPPATLIIRQIPASEIDHYKINSTSSEKRGRSELFAILGYLQRFRQFVDDRLLLQKVRSMFAVDVSVDGQPKDVAAAEAQFQTPPGTGSVMIHNKNVEVKFQSAEASDSTTASTDADLFLKIIAVGAGVSQSFLGVGGTEGTRAGALIQTEPDVKNFEDYQEMVQSILEDNAERVFFDAKARRQLPAPKGEIVVGVTFPSIAQEDRSSKLKDVGFSESMGWFSKRRSANIAADEFKQNDYDYDTEQAVIAKENEEMPVIAGAMSQITKGDPAILQAQLGGVAETEPSGPDAAASIGNTTGEEDALITPGAQTGSVIPSNATRALPSTGTNLRGKGLDREDEKNRINLRSSETPIRPGKAFGWAATARAASLAARKRKSELRKIEEAKRAQGQEG